MMNGMLEPNSLGEGRGTYIPGLIRAKSDEMSSFDGRCDLLILMELQSLREGQLCLKEEESVREERNETSKML